MANSIRRNPAQQRKVMEEFKESGLGKDAFCKLHGLKVNTFETWFRRQRRSAVKKESNFLPVRIDDGAAVVPVTPLRVAALRIVGPRGLVAEFSAESEPAWLASILGRLL